MKINIAIILLILFLNGCNNNTKTNNTTLKLDRTDTLTGIDKNNNGIRDDVEQFILNTYKNIPQQKAAMQSAKSTQYILTIDTNDSIAVKKALLLDNKATDCVFKRFNNIQDPSIIIEQIESMTYNTKKRASAYLNFSKALDGTSWKSHNGEVCE